MDPTSALSPSTAQRAPIDLSPRRSAAARLGGKVRGLAPLGGGPAAAVLGLALGALRPAARERRLVALRDFRLGSLPRGLAARRWGRVLTHGVLLRSRASARRSRSAAPRAMRSYSGRRPASARPT